MSAEHRKTIHAVVGRLAMSYVETMKLSPPERDKPQAGHAEAEALLEKQRGEVLSVADLVAHALCDLNRIADAQETLASPQSEDGKNYWDGLAAAAQRIAKALEARSPGPIALAIEARSPGPIVLAIDGKVSAETLTQIRNAFQPAAGDYPAGLGAG